MGMITAAPTPTSAKTPTTTRIVPKVFQVFESAGLVFFFFEENARKIQFDQVCAVLNVRRHTVYGVLQF
jgi:hypothetical protein